MHHRTFICKLDLGLWSRRFTDPVIKLISPKTSGRSCWGSQWVFLLSVHVNEPLSNLHFITPGRQKGHTGTSTPPPPVARALRSAVTAATRPSITRAQAGAPGDLDLHIVEVPLPPSSFTRPISSVRCSMQLPTEVTRPSCLQCQQQVMSHSNQNAPVSARLNVLPRADCNLL